MSLSARRAWIEIAYPLGPQAIYPKSLSARRAWIEISGSLDDILAGVSLSARRAWIEIRRALGFVEPDKSLSARRAWIEIARIVFVLLVNGGRSPQGERG